MLKSDIDHFNILYISLEFKNWKQARSWSYQTSLGFEEGFAANGISFLTVPAISEFAPSDPASWLSHLKAICDGKQFEQVWIEVIHNNLDDMLLSYIATLAPVRLAIIGESLRYPEEVYVHAPNLRNRQAEAVHRLRYLTHGLVGDERDVEWLNSHGIVKALWWVQGIPERVMSSSAPPATYRDALFSGALYGEREQWLNHPLLKGLLAQQQPLEEDAQLPDLFDKVNAQVIGTLRSVDVFSEELLNLHMELLRKIRKQSFALWLKGLACGSAVVNLPSFFQGYAGRVYEGMAAGRPVMSWNIPDRPRTRALFEDGKEILLFSKDDPLQLAEHILRVQRDPEFGMHISENACNKLLQHHTIELRVKQILNWIENDIEPDYGIAESSNSDAVFSDNYYRQLFTQDPDWSSPHPNEDEKRRWEKISNYLNVIVPKLGKRNNKNARILEIGSGRGWLTNLLTSYGQVVGLEPVKPVIDQAAKLFPDITFMHGTTDTLIDQYPLSSFDIIVSSEVIEHVPHIEQQHFVHNISRLVTPDGYVIITTPRKEIYELLKMRGVCSNQPVEDWLTEQEMSNLFMKNGMSPLGLSNIFIDAETLKFILPGSPSHQNVLALYQIWLLQKSAA